MFLRPAVIMSIATGLIVALLVFAWLLARPLMLIFAAIVIAEAVAPVAKRLERWLPRAVSILAVYLALLAAIGAGVSLLAAPLVDQAATLFANAPDLVDEMQDRIDGIEILGDGTLTQALENPVTRFSATLVNLPFAIVASIAEVFVVIVMSIYWLLTLPALRRFIHSLMPETRRIQFDLVSGEIGQTMGGYVRATVIDAVIVFMLVYIGLRMIGVQFPMVLALIAALGELVPVAGPVIAAVPAVAVALLDSPTQALIVLVFYLVLQQFESHVLMPNIMHKQAHIPPLITIVALIVGGSIGGILGALIAIPASGAIRVLVLRTLAPAIRRWFGLPPQDSGSAGLAGEHDASLRAAGGGAA